MVRQGNIDNPPKTPLVPGFECSGIVEALGDSVKGFEVMRWLLMEKCDIYLELAEIIGGYANMSEIICDGYYCCFVIWFYYQCL